MKSLNTHTKVLILLGCAITIPLTLKVLSEVYLYKLPENDGCFWTGRSRGALTGILYRYSCKSGVFWALDKPPRNPEKIPHTKDENPTIEAP